jgi:hypothetical protein
LEDEDDQEDPSDEGTTPTSPAWRTMPGPRPSQCPAH